MNQREALNQWTTIVADTGDIEAIREHKPEDATTNPSLILAATENPEYRWLIDSALEFGSKHGDTLDEKVSNALDKVLVNFGAEILKIVPGRVSTEVDANLSFDVQGTVDKAHRIIALYEELGISRERILIKIASTWEGIQAAQLLEAEGIHINMTLMFSLAQAVMAAEAGATLISPFVGRILDWYKKAEGVDGYPASQDPGVLSVQRIYSYYKTFDYPTQIMGASFRNKGEILELAGCDLLTISPKLLSELEGSEEPVARKLEPSKAKDPTLRRRVYSENEFRWAMNEDAMAIEKLSDGIRRFSADLRKLERQLAEALQAIA